MTDFTWAQPFIANSQKPRPTPSEHAADTVLVNDGNGLLLTVIDEPVSAWLTMLDDALQTLDPTLGEMDFTDNRIMPYRMGENGEPVERYDHLTAWVHSDHAGSVTVTYRGSRMPTRASWPRPGSRKSRRSIMRTDERTSPDEALYLMFHAGYRRAYDIGQPDLEERCRGSFRRLLAEHDEHVRERNGRV